MEELLKQILSELKDIKKDQAELKYGHERVEKKIGELEREISYLSYDLRLIDDRLEER